MATGGVVKLPDINIIYIRQFTSFNYSIMLINVCILLHIGLVITENVAEGRRKKGLGIDDEGRRKRGKYDGPKIDNYDKFCKLPVYIFLFQMSVHMHVHVHVRVHVWLCIRIKIYEQGF